MRKGKNRITVLLLLLIVFMVELLVSCGRDRSTDIPVKDFGMDYSQQQDFSSTVQVVCNANSAWFINAVKDAPIYKWTPQTLGKEREQIEWQSEEGNYDLISIAECQGALYAHMRNCEDNMLEIRKFGVDGNWTSVMSLTVENWDDYAVMGNGFFVDSSENVYIVSKDGVTCFDKVVKEGKTYRVKGTVCLWAENGKGSVGCVAATTNEITLYELKENEAEKKWTLQVSVQGARGIRSSEETLCLATDHEILFLDRKTGSLVARTDIMKLGIHSVMAGYYDERCREMQVYSLAGTDTDRLQYSVLRERESSEEHRKEIIYGMVSGVNKGDTSSIWRSIAAFNQTSNEYYVTIRDYNNNTDRLHADLAAGNGPDVIDMTYSEHYESYVKNGYLEDLSPYLEQSQYQDDIIWNILDAFKIEGGLYIFTPQVQLWGVAIHPEYETTFEEWNMGSFLELVEQDQWKKAPIGGQIGNPQTLLFFLLSGLQEEMIDREKKKASIETEEFIKLLKLCREYAEGDWSYAKEQTYEEQKRNILCQEIYLGWNFTTYLSHADVYGREYPVYGYPTCFGQTYKITACPDSCAIYSGSSRKEGAWAFIESLLWESNQMYCGIVDPGFPIRSSVLEKVAKESKEMPVRFNGAMITITDAEIRIVEEILYHGKLCNGMMDRNIWLVIWEETAPYFAGDKSAEEVAHIIQSRVELILNE